ncbi:MAG TPA: alpha/beta hydrolase [Ideonella sp.]|nr:alpha/beta hydrolase [Ideonella sp.]
MPGTIVFAHANGFGAGTYRVMFDAWRAAGWEVQAPERLGHDPRFPVASNWRALRDELLAFTEASAPGEQVHFVGHSLGGLLSLMAACKRPELAAGLVMLDSPVVTGWRAHGLRVFKSSGLIKRVSPGKIAQRRRHEWPTREAVQQHFAGKAVFARWDPRVLADYVASGFDQHESGIRLGFQREIETRIYNTLPDHLGPLLRKHPPRCPVGFIAGTQSAEIRQGGAEGAKLLARERFVWFEGTHLYPMEQPERTAAAVLSLIESFPDAR